MIKNRGMFLLVALSILAMVNFACAEAHTTPGQEVKQYGKRKAGMCLHKTIKPMRGTTLREVF